MAKIDEYLTREQPIERLILEGRTALSDTELIAILLRTGLPGTNVMDLARSLLSEYRSLRAMSKLSPKVLMEKAGIGKNKAATLCAAFEIANRLEELRLEPKQSLNTPEKIYRYLRRNLVFKERERFYVLAMNTKYEIIDEHLVSLGTDRHTFSEPKEVFKNAIKLGAYAICVAHNHPSGHIEPSKEDVGMTRRLEDAGKILGIQLLDHLIIGENDYYSMKTNGDI